jgi:photosystem II stability/assembly factor-like uncharacterized protein
MNLLPAAFLASVVCAQTCLPQTWAPQTSGSTASLRGVSAVNTQVVWASGTAGAYLQTTDGGVTWKAAQVPGAEALDFRGIRAIDGRTVYLLSSGTADKARIYKTTDGGSHWALQLTNPDPKGFFDAITFWDPAHGIVLGDPVDGRFAIFTTGDGGLHWQRQPTPPALPNEGAFAASNTCLFVLGTREAWFGTGGPGGARVFHSRDRGLTWTVAATPIRNDGPSAGIFSLAFSDSRHGVAVGGDYAKDREDRQNIAVTDDGGLTWTAPAGPGPKGFRSAVAYLPHAKMWLATGTSGSDVSADNGKTWKLFDSGAYNAVSFASTGTAGWAVGPRGRIAAFREATN